MSEKARSDNPATLADAKKEEEKQAPQTTGDKAEVEDGGAKSAAGAGQAISPGETVGILPAQHWAEQAPSLHDDDADSAYDDNASSTASITSTILQYRTIHGRTYHSETGNAHYWASNDEQQIESMDIAHHAFLLALDHKLFLAPVNKDVKRVVDIGTGTGIWAIDFADEFPNCEVIGTDVSPIQPSWVPPNLRFEIEDCTLPWTFPPNHFDYIHMRFLVGSIDNWTALFKEAYKSCQPGGYVESFEVSPHLESDDGTVTERSAMGQWGKFYVEGGRKFNRTFTVFQDGTQKKAMEQAGFVDVQVKDIKTPLGGWPADPKMKELGRFTQLSLTQDTEGYVLFLAHALGWTREEILVYVAQLVRELRSGKYHAYYRQRIVWGCKPETS